MTPPFSIFLLQSQGNDLATWIAVSIGALGLLYLLMRKSKHRRDPLSNGPAFSLSQQRGVERQMESLLVELSNMARQITAQLDTRAAKLELLIKEADDRLIILGRTLVNPPSQAPHRPFEHPAAPAPARFVAPPVVTHSPAPLASQPETDDRYADVYSLADEGVPSPEIARRLGQPTGEVELILALRPR